MSHSTWTSSEDKILIEYYEHGSIEEMLSKLPGRTRKSCYKRSIILGLFRQKDDAWKKEEDEILIKFYSNTCKDELMKLLPGRSWKAVVWHAMNVLRIFRDKETTQEETRRTNRSKIGCDYPSQSAEVRSKVKETVQKKFGVDNVFQSEEIKEIIVQTNLAKFGYENPNQCPEIQQKTSATNLKKYGIENPFQLTDRVQKGMLDKYGDTCPLRVPEIKERQQATNIQRYGFPTPAQNQEVRKKLREILNTPEVKVKKYLALKNKENFSGSKEEDDFYAHLKEIDPDTIQHVLHPITKDTIDYYMPLHDLWIQYDGAYWHGKLKGVDGPQAQNIKNMVERDKIQNELIPNLVRFGSEEVKQAVKENRITNFIKDSIEEKIEGSKLQSCHQYRKKIQYYEQDIDTLPFNPDSLKASDFDLGVEDISDEIITFIEKYEWLGHIGVMPKWCFTAKYNGFLGGVVLINEPSAYSKILGEDTPKYEALIQRGASSSWAPKNLGSRLIMFSCNWMVKNTEKRAFIGYADLSARERGIIYRACNFEYLGDGFGVSELLRHPSIPHLFTSHSLKRTSMFRRWCGENNITLEKSWFKENKFKNLETIPEEIKNSWYKWAKKIVDESEKIKIDKKLKYVLVLGKDKREYRALCSLKQYKPLPYPSDSTKSAHSIRIIRPAQTSGTKNKLNPEKEKFIIENYGKKTVLEIAEAMGESKRWIKRILDSLSDEGKIKRLRPNKPVEDLLTSESWVPEIKNRAITLRTDFLKSSHEICDILEKEFGFKIKEASLNFWFKNFNVPFPTKKEWLIKFLPKETAQKLKNDNYRAIDFVSYLKNLYGVYVSDDAISTYLHSILP
jgi:hypothetical protein